MSVQSERCGVKQSFWPFFFPGAKHALRPAGPRPRFLIGSHEYKFLIDGETFRHAPGNPESAGFFHNSLIRLP